MLYGIRYTVYCIRYTVYGIRYTVYGIRYTVYGTRCTVYGIRYTVYGVRYTGIRYMGIRYTVHGYTVYGNLPIFATNESAQNYPAWSAKSELGPPEYFAAINSPIASICNIELRPRGARPENSSIYIYIYILCVLSWYDVNVTHSK